MYSILEKTPIFLALLITFKETLYATSILFKLENCECMLPTTKSGINFGLSNYNV